MQGIPGAPLWDSSSQQFVGMLTASDFISILQRVSERTTWLLFIFLLYRLLVIFVCLWWDLVGSYWLRWSILNMFIWPSSDAIQFMIFSIDYIGHAALLVLRYHWKILAFSSIPGYLIYVACAVHSLEAMVLQCFLRKSWKCTQLKNGKRRSKHFSRLHPIRLYMWVLRCVSLSVPIYMSFKASLKKIQHGK